MKEFIRVHCPITYGECIYTEEFNKRTLEEGWQVEKAMYCPELMRVTFVLSKEV